MTQNRSAENGICLRADLALFVLVLVKQKFKLAAFQASDGTEPRTSEPFNPERLFLFFIEDLIYPTQRGNHIGKAGGR